MRDFYNFKIVIDVYFLIWVPSPIKNAAPRHIDKAPINHRYMYDRLSIVHIAASRAGAEYPSGCNLSAIVQMAPGEENDTPREEMPILNRMKEALVISGIRLADFSIF